MSYQLNKPYTENQKADFIVKYNRKQGLEIVETAETLYALEKNEIMIEGVPVINVNYEKELEQEEQMRKNMLFLTAADVERAIYKAKGMDFDDIIEFVKSNPPEGLDIKGLKIELRANNFYRGNPYVAQIGELLGYSSDDLDYLFENKEFKSETN